jgi:AraC family transcriptional regulator of adaptative response/methylated-DNA-[protein]-cysteine methyltransferase
MKGLCSMNNLYKNKMDPAASLVCSPQDDIKIYYCEIETPLGPMMAIAHNEALLYLNFSDCSKLNQQINRLKKGSPEFTGRTKFTGRIKPQYILKENIIISVLKNELNLYFKKELQEFKTPLAFFC